MKSNPWLKPADGAWRDLQHMHQHISWDWPWIEPANHSALQNQLSKLHAVPSSNPPAVRYLFMPGTYPRPPAWLWGLSFGVFIGGGVVLTGALKYGFRPELLLLGGVLVLVFAIIGLFSGLVRRYTPGGPT